MSRKQRRVKHAQRRKEKTAERIALVSKIDALVRPMGCRITGLGPSAVGVQGDARTYGVSVVIRFPPDATATQIGEVSTAITNRVSDVTRVLMDI